MKDQLNTLLRRVKSWPSNHKALLRRTGVIAVSALIVLILTASGYFLYCRWAYPDHIILDDAFYDVSALDLSFTDRDLDGSFDEPPVPVTLSDPPDRVLVEENRVTIRSEGTYLLQGQWEEKMLLVDAGETAKVQLILDGFHIQNSDGAAFYIRTADKVFITTKEGTENSVSDGTLCATDGDTNIDAAIFSKADLTLNGSGKLTVRGNAAHGIVSKDDLVVASGSYEITAVKKGFNGKDRVKICRSTIAINSGTDGISSDNTEAGTGYVYIEDGTIRIESDRDGIQTATALILKEPSITITTGGGSINAPQKQVSRGKGRQEDDAAEETETTESTKGLKSAGDILITGGEYQIDSPDDSIHADHSIRVEGGSFTVQSGDDGFHAEHTLQITGGTIDVEKSFEGLEGYQIALSGGNVTVTATDDGINATSGSSIVGSIKGLFATGTLGKLEITGGALTVTSGGDSLDSNGVMSITGGVTLVAGPAGQGDGIIDCDAGAQVDGGTLLCVSLSGSGGKGSGTGNLFETKSQLQLSKTVARREAGTLLQLRDAQGTVLASFVTTAPFNKIAATAPELQSEGDGAIYLNDQPL